MSLISAVTLRQCRIRDVGHITASVNTTSPCDSKPKPDFTVPKNDSSFSVKVLWAVPLVSLFVSVTTEAASASWKGLAGPDSALSHILTNDSNSLENKLSAAFCTPGRSSIVACKYGNVARQHLSMWVPVLRKLAMLLRSVKNCGPSIAVCMEHSPKNV